MANTTLALAVNLTKMAVTPTPIIYPPEVTGLVFYDTLNNDPVHDMRFNIFCWIVTGCAAVAQIFISLTKRWHRQDLERQQREMEEDERIRFDAVEMATLRTIHQLVPPPAPLPAHQVSESGFEREESLENDFRRQDRLERRLARPERRPLSVIDEETAEAMDAMETGRAGARYAQELAYPPWCSIRPHSAALGVS